MIESISTLSSEQREQKAYEHWRVCKAKDWQPITKTSRCFRNGRVIKAPCGHAHLIYHLNWSALYCSTCHEEFNKNEYLMEGKRG